MWAAIVANTTWTAESAPITPLGSEQTCQGRRSHSAPPVLKSGTAVDTVERMETGARSALNRMSTNLATTMTPADHAGVGWVVASGVVAQVSVSSTGIRARSGPLTT